MSTIERLSGGAVYPSNLEFGEFETKAPKNVCLECDTITRRPGSSENNSLGVNPTGSKFETSSCLRCLSGGLGIGPIRLEENDLIEPKEIVKGAVFGATFERSGETLFLRMELLTQENKFAWENFKRFSGSMANGDMGYLSSLVLLKSVGKYPKYDDAVKQLYGFTEDEYHDFEAKADSLIKSGPSKMKALLCAASGINYMNTYNHMCNYIVYISKNPDFSIIKANEPFNKHLTVKVNEYIKTYRDILITCGSDFRRPDSFENRGISRNPYWVLEGKYAGLSMLLHGFTGAVAEKFFPEKQTMRVSPIGSMQVIIQQSLKPNEGYCIQQRKKVDITALAVKKDAGEQNENVITVSALIRIYKESLKGEKLDI